MDVLLEIQRAAHQAAVWMERSLEDEALTHAEANILAFIGTHPGCSINDLHHHFGHRRSTLTSLIDRLERRSLVRRAPNPESRRSICLELTDIGESAGRDVIELATWLEEQIRFRVSNSDLVGFMRVVKALEESLHDG